MDFELLTDTKMRAGPESAFHLFYISMDFSCRRRKNGRTYLAKECRISAKMMIIKYLRTQVWPMWLKKPRYLKKSLGLLPNSFWNTREK